MALVNKEREEDTRAAEMSRLVAGLDRELFLLNLQHGKPRSTAISHPENSWLLLLSTPRGRKGKERKETIKWPTSGRRTGRGHRTSFERASTYHSTKARDEEGDEASYQAKQKLKRKEGGGGRRKGSFVGNKNLQPSLGRGENGHQTLLPSSTPLPYP